MEIFDDIEKGIISILEPIPKEASINKWSTDKWTPEIMERLFRLGKTFSYDVYISSFQEASGGEWLFDMTWLFNKNGYMISVPLVLESEWDLNGIDDDFQKLIVARAEHRVMIFQQKTKEDVLKKVEKFKEWIRNFMDSQRGDRYLFAGYDFDTTSFEFHIYVV